MSSATSSWLASAVAVFAKDWRCELRSRYALHAIALFAVTTLVVASSSLGPLGADKSQAVTVLPALLWLILLFAAAAGLPRAFVHEEEAHTSAALRLAAPPSALFAGKLAYGASLLLGLEALIAPLYLALMSLDVPSPGLFAATLLAGGYGLAAGSSLIAALASQARGRSTLFSVLAFPVLLPLLLLAIELTRNAVAGQPAGVALPQLLLYDASVTVAGLMLFPFVWNP
ncbi:MAG TPA: heme exporter protein CcmB [Thermoanaerobaculia bacterium]|nr:heme exporter protein CcmB [Thermoanaerobaculia bacterium]